jgi:NAD(P)-dependent dehydrogenase (short-subunit alcohol dehydrogenase family)
VQADLDRAVELAIDGFGGIDILIANAGVWSMGPFWELSDQQWDDVMSVNLSGVWRTTKAVAPHMIGRRSGSIVMTSSINGFEAAAQWAHYAAAKHGVIGLMRSVALELAPFGVRCNAICPSTVDTGMVNWQGSYDLGVGHEGGTREEFTESVRGMHALAQAAVLPPEVVAEAALWLASDGASAITGVVLPVDAGHSLLPRINMAPVV